MNKKIKLNNEWGKRIIKPFDWENKPKSKKRLNNNIYWKKLT